LAVFFLLVKTPTRAVDGNLFGGIFLVGENTNKGCGNLLAIHQQGLWTGTCLAVFVLLVKTPTRAVDGNLFGGIFLVGENTNKGCGRELVWW
jgi:hypothetical protein